MERDDGKAWWVFTLFGGNGAPAASKAYPLTTKTEALAKFLKLYRLKTANAFGTRKYEQQEDRFTVVPDLKAAMGDDFTKAVLGVESNNGGKKGGKAAAKAAEKLKKKMEKKAKAGGSDSDSDSSSSSSSSSSDSDSSSSSSDGEPAECSLSTPLQEVVEWCCNDGKDGTCLMS